MTREQAIRITRKLWRWLAEDCNRQKKQWPGWEDNGGNVKRCKYDCPLCEYVKGQMIIKKEQYDNEFLNCKYCPFQWPEEENCLFSHESPYLLWAYGNKKDRKIYAKHISEMPLKK